MHPFSKIDSAVRGVLGVGKFCKPLSNRGLPNGLNPEEGMQNAKGSKTGKGIFIINVYIVIKHSGQIYEKRFEETDCRLSV